ncbi:MAG: transcriptional regulator [Bacteroidia bacterium]|nr:MAG: transcriptional regulator [Bacteroidia bacterium]
MDRENTTECPVRRALSVLGGKWTLLILFSIGRDVLRYGELKRSLPGISEKVLASELKSLVGMGLLAREAFPEVPPRVEYRLTPKGLEALGVVEVLSELGERL